MFLSDEVPITRMQTHTHTHTKMAFLCVEKK